MRHVPRPPPTRRARRGVRMLDPPAVDEAHAPRVQLRQPPLRHRVRPHRRSGGAFPDPSRGGLRRARAAADGTGKPDRAIDVALGMAGTLEVYAAFTKLDIASSCQLRVRVSSDRWRDARQCGSRGRRRRGRASESTRIRRKGAGPLHVAGASEVRSESTRVADGRREQPPAAAGCGRGL